MFGEELRRGKLNCQHWNEGHLQEWYSCNKWYSQWCTIISDILSDALNVYHSICCITVLSVILFYSFKAKPAESHDWYCFDCQESGEVVLCDFCCRVFHRKCAKAHYISEDDNWKCPSCKVWRLTFIIAYCLWSIVKKNEKNACPKHFMAFNTVQ